MKITKRRKVTVVVVMIAILVVGGIAINSQNIIDYLVEQSSNPTGFVGMVMTKIWNQSFRSMTDWGISNIALADSDVVLDVGCGGGSGVTKLSSLVTDGKVYGIDISEESIKTSQAANESLIKAGRVEILLADVMDMQFDDNMFDTVMTVQSHIYWSELQIGLEEIYRVLKPSGTLLIICERDKINYHMVGEYKSDEAMESLLLKIGFQEVEILEKGNWVSFICSA